MKLGELVAASPMAELLGDAPADALEREVTGIVYDSREVRPGSLFVARHEKGYHVDGHQYIAAAAANGAVAAVVQPEYLSGNYPPEIRGGNGNPPPENTAGSGNPPPENTAGRGNPPPEIRGGNGNPPPENTAGSGNPPPENTAGRGNPPPEINEGISSNPPLENTAGSHNLPPEIRGGSDNPPPEIRGGKGGTLPLIVSPDTGTALADFAAAFYGYPARKMRVVGVTGTDGKTTTTFLISKVLEQGGHKTGLFGTVYFKVGERLWDNPTRATTPEAVEVQELLAEMVAEGCDYAVLESSSHGLAQHRLDHCEYDVAVLTNITHEHLDFHGTVEAYRLAKAKLFDFLGTAVDKGSPKVGVVNLDDPQAKMYIERVPANGQVLTYGVENERSNVRALNIVSSANGLRYTAATPIGNVDLNLLLTGSFNVYNSLAAIAVGISQGVSLTDIKTALEQVPGVAGRMEQIQAGQDFTCIVDYAHTPGAMDKVLGILRPLTTGKLIAVVGSAGERDLAKRPMIGVATTKWCDFVVFTDEDPRFEEPMAIINEIATGAEAQGKHEGRDFLKIVDRREAIATAFDHAAAGDIVALLGKGHEQCIIVGKDKLPWDDRTVARELLLHRVES